MNDKDQNVEIEAIAEQWVQIALAHIQAKHVQTDQKLTIKKKEEHE